MKQMKIMLKHFDKIGDDNADDVTGRLLNTTLALLQPGDIFLVFTLGDS